MNKNIDFKNIPIYIISFNRLEDLKLLIENLENKGYKNIHILDNKSTYPPLLEYYKNINHTIHYLDKNYGHMVFWECGQFDDVIKNQYYAISDSDILPVNECPDDFIELFYNILKKNPKFTKVGFSLKIDDIPDTFSKKEFMQTVESQFYILEHEFKYKGKKQLVYDASLDTTFALYKPNIKLSKFTKGIRTGFPYQTKHLPWYKDENNKSEEDIYYINHVKTGVSNYSIDMTNKDLFNKFKREEKKETLKEKIFSVKNIDYRRFKEITILGLKFKFKRKTIKG